MEPKKFLIKKSTFGSRTLDRKANAEESNTNVFINNGINPSVKFDKIEDPLEKLQEEIPRKELTTVMKGIYFDSEVWNVVEEQSKRSGRGGKSQLVNEIVKNYFINKGIL